MAKKKSKKKTKSKSGSIDKTASTAATSDANATSQANGNNSRTNSPKPKPISPDKKFPLEEDLSLQRHDEETVLSAIYGDDFSLESGAWNCPLYKLRIRPASDVSDHGNDVAAASSSDAPRLPHVEGLRDQSCELTLRIQLNRRYPYSVPLLQITDAVGVSTGRMSELLALLQAKARECADLGAVMGWEMGQVAEGYLVDCAERRKREKAKREEDMRKVAESSVDNDEYYGPDDEDVGEITTSIPRTEFDMMDSDTQKEVARQIEALSNAAQMRKQRRQRAGMLSSIADKNDEEDDGSECGSDFLRQLPNGFDLDDPALAPGAYMTPNEGGDAEPHGGRYRTDFFEIAHLGRGGGGEVVRAINRLDRRFYAIKKILVESEMDEGDNDGDGRKNKGAAFQNEKLRREVRTISMMSHKNIVRYYQAWEEHPNRDRTEMMVESETQSKNDGDNDDETSSWGSYSSSGSSPGSSSSSSSSSATGQVRGSQSTNPLNADYFRSLSLDNFLENETEFANPLMFGSAMIGYPPIAEKNSSSKPQQLPSKSGSKSDWTGSNLESQRLRQDSKDFGILYIQVRMVLLILDSSLIPLE